MEIFKLKNVLTKVKNSPDRLNSRFVNGRKNNKKKID